MFLYSLWIVCSTALILGHPQVSDVRWKKHQVSARCILVARWDARLVWQSPKVPFGLINSIHWFDVSQEEERKEPSVTPQTSKPPSHGDQADIGTSVLQGNREQPPQPRKPSDTGRRATSTGLSTASLVQIQLFPSEHVLLYLLYLYI